MLIKLDKLSDLCMPHLTSLSSLFPLVWLQVLKGVVSLDSVSETNHALTLFMQNKIQMH